MSGAFGASRCLAWMPSSLTHNQSLEQPLVVSASLPCTYEYGWHVADEVCCCTSWAAGHHYDVLVFAVLSVNVTCVLCCLRVHWTLGGERETHFGSLPLCGALHVSVCPQTAVGLLKIVDRVATAVPTPSAKWTSA
jgi:hypothetical protein